MKNHEEVLEYRKIIKYREVSSYRTVIKNHGLWRGYITNI